MKKKRVYISGPISGLSRRRYMARFALAEEYLKRQGFQVCNPTRLAPCRWLWLYRLMGYRLTLLYDLWHLMRCSHIYLMDGWKDSRGAQIEWSVAYRLHIEIVPSAISSSADLAIRNYDNYGEK